MLLAQKFVITHQCDRCFGIVIPFFFKFNVLQTLKERTLPLSQYNITDESLNGVFLRLPGRFVYLKS